MIHIRCQHEIVFVFHQIIQLMIDWFRGIHIPIDINIPAPVSPMLFQCIVWVEPAGIHIFEMILFRKVMEVSVKSFSCINKTRGSRETGASANHYGFRRVNLFFQPFDMIIVIRCRCLCPNL